MWPQKRWSLRFGRNTCTRSGGWERVFGALADSGRTGKCREPPRRGEASSSVLNCARRRRFVWLASTIVAELCTAWRMRWLVAGVLCLLGAWYSVVFEFLGWDFTKRRIGAGKGILVKMPKKRQVWVRLRPANSGRRAARGSIVEGSYARADISLVLAIAAKADRGDFGESSV